MTKIEKLISELAQGDLKALARCITIVENELKDYEIILTHLSIKDVPVIGITGPPGAGKSTLINALIKKLLAQDQRIGIIAIDPTSPFNYGSLLGDRLRMGEHFINENVFIRSLATRGSLGGLSAKIIEVTDVMKSSNFDYIIIETVGVGQSEIEIVGLADTTILVLVPEAGDEVQTLKSGIMEIADIFVINKADREGAEIFVKNLQHLLHAKKGSDWTPAVIKSIATNGEGTQEIISSIQAHQKGAVNNKRLYLLTEKAYRLIQNFRMKDSDKSILEKQIKEEMNKKGFNLYKWIKKNQLL